MRINGRWLPLESAENTNYAEVARSNEIDGTCESNVDCSAVVCPVTQECVDYWRMPQCV